MQRLIPTNILHFQPDKTLLDRRRWTVFLRWCRHVVLTYLQSVLSSATVHCWSLAGWAHTSCYLYLYSIFSLQLASTHSFHSNGLGGIEDWKWHTGHSLSLSPAVMKSMRCKACKVTVAAWAWGGSLVLQMLRQHLEQGVILCWCPITFNSLLFRVEGKVLNLAGFGNW